MKTYVFPGQGSQRKGMGENLFEKYKHQTEIANEILGYSIKDLCINNPDHLLNQTEYTQPAMYVVNALHYQEKIEIGDRMPDFLAGHSLGEYNALQAAGVISFDSGLRLVKKRGELMGREKDGAMAAIINLSEQEIINVLVKSDFNTIDIANLNTPTQIVISGLKEDIKNVQSYFEERNAKFIVLNTSGAFHSRYMKEAKKEFENYLRGFEFEKPTIPVISNVTATPHEPDHLKLNLSNQMIKCVRWTDSIVFLLKQGKMEFEELGSGNVLTKLITAIRNDTDRKQESVATEKKISEKNIQNDKVGMKEKNSCDLTNLKNTLNAEELVEFWNKTYPVGTKVVSNLFEIELETKTEAMILFGHRAAVYIKGYNGYFDLKEVTPIQ